MTDREATGPGGDTSALKSEWPADNVKRRGSRNRSCVSCGAVDVVRSDNKAERCASCAGREAGANGVAVIKARAIAREKPCQSCGSPHRNKKYCSVSCKSAAVERQARTCKCCGAGFDILASTLMSSNASGNFCSRACYKTFLCRTERTTGRGSQWKKARDEAVKKAPFCAICGTTKSLQVHHIIPFRLTMDNSQGNLIPLCVKHHRWVETILVETEAFGFDDTARVAWVGMLKERQMATAAKLMDIRHAYV